MSKSEGLQIVPPDPKKHLPEMFEMCSQVFSQGMGYYGCYNWCNDAYIMNSNYDWKSSCIGIMDGKIVTHFGIWDYDMRIGSARVRTGGVGLVATHGNYRKRGLMAVTTRASLDLMTRNGYDVSFLFGISGFYHQFRYVAGWNNVDYTIEIHHMPKDKPQHRVHSFAPRHRDDLAQLYNRENATRTGTAVRPTYLRPQWPDKWQGFLWKDADKVVGYVVVSRGNDTLEVLDCVGDDKETLAILGMLLQRFHLKNLHFGGLHYDNPLRKRITRQSYSWSRTTYLNNGGPMICTLNLKSTLTKMAGELSRRLKRSYLADWRGSLLIADDREKVSLAIDRSRVKVAPPAKTSHRITGGPYIAQFLLGTHDPSETIEIGNIKLAGDAPRLVEVLFPNKHPSLAPWDHY